MPFPLNQIDNPSVLEEQIGKHAIVRVDRLCRWLFGPGTEPHYHFAPSIITRSECELFGISGPRFAIRKYVFTEKESEGRGISALFNLRRLQWFCNSIRNAHPTLFQEDQLAAFADHGGALADSLIIPPKRYDAFHVMRCNLGSYYGLEAGSPGLLPFLQHIQLGGGMCAQACIFMSLCLQEQYASGISGVAELTAIANEGNKLNVKGLEDSQIIRVLNSEKCGLAAFREVIAPNWNSSRTRSRMLSAALRAYALSNVPVICVLDLTKFAGLHLPYFLRRWFSVYGKNGVVLRPRKTPAADCRGRPPAKSPATKDCKPGADCHTRPPEEIPTAEKRKPAKHAVLVVGCDRTGGLKSRFLLNDPAKYPLFQATFRDLRNAAINQNLTLIPVLPPAVKTPLLGRLPGMGGVMEWSRVVQVVADGSSAFGVSENSRHWPGEWSLVDFGTLSQRSGNDNIPVAQCHLQSMLLEAGNRGDLPPIGWYWVQQLRTGLLGWPFRRSTSSQVWIWDSKADGPMKPELRAKVMERVVAVFDCDSVSLVTRYTRKSGKVGVTK